MLCSTLSMALSGGFDVIVRSQPRSVGSEINLLPCRYEFRSFFPFWASSRGIVAAVQSHGPPKVRVMGSLGSFCETPAVSTRRRVMRQEQRFCMQRYQCRSVMVRWDRVQSVRLKRFDVIGQTKKFESRSTPKEAC